MMIMHENKNLITKLITSPDSHFETDFNYKHRNTKALCRDLPIKHEIGDDHCSRKGGSNLSKALWCMGVR